MGRNGVREKPDSCALCVYPPSIGSGQAERPVELQLARAAAVPFHGNPGRHTFLVKSRLACAARKAVKMRGAERHGQAGVAPRGARNRDACGVLVSRGVAGRPDEQVRQVADGLHGTASERDTAVRDGLHEKCRAFKVSVFSL